MSPSRDHDNELLAECRELFDVPDDVAYFNVANLAPHLHSVRRAGDEALDKRGRPWTIEPADWFSDVERLRLLFGRILGTDAEGVALIPATSYGFAVAARNLHVEAGERIVVLAEEYPSGIYTWRQLARETGAELVTVTRDASQTWTEAILECLDERTSIISVPNVHWTDGALIELDKVAPRAHELDARLVIDASQSAGAMPLDVTALRPDFVIAVGYKWLLGPFGLGYLYVAEQQRAGPGARAELDPACRLRGLRPAGRLPRRAAARCPAVRRGTAHQLRADSDGDRCPRTDPRLGRRADSRHAGSTNLTDRFPRARARSRSAARRAAWPAHARDRPAGSRPVEHAGRPRREQLLRRHPQRITQDRAPPAHHGPRCGEPLHRHWAATSPRT